MKNRIILLPLYMVLALCRTSVAIGQEMLKGGNMEDESAWKVSHLDSDDTTKYQFNYTEAGPSAGSGGCLYLWGDIVEDTNILFWQELILKAGVEYEISGAFVDLGNSIENFWCEILVSTEAPPDSPGVDYGGSVTVAFNTWDGTQPGIDGTFQDDYSKGPGPWYTAPDTLGTEVTVYFALNVGVWAGGTTRSFDVAVDELSFVVPEGTGVEVSPVVVNQFELYQNYPNPFNSLTQIQYSLTSEKNVRLKVCDMLGHVITTLVDQRQLAGNYSVQWDGRDDHGNGVSNGVYIYKLQAGSYAQTRKMILVK